MLYHVTTGLPDIQLPRGPQALAYGPHARQAAREDRYGDLSSYLLRRLDLRVAQVVEVEEEGGALRKIVARCQIPSTSLDIVYVLEPRRRGEPGLFVRTVWANERSDTHATLRKWRYAALAAA